MGLGEADGMCQSLAFEFVVAPKLMTPIFSGQEHAAPVADPLPSGQSSANVADSP